MKKIQTYNYNNRNKELVGAGHLRGVKENVAALLDGDWWLSTPVECRRCTLRDVIEWIKVNF